MKNYARTAVVMLSLSAVAANAEDGFFIGATVGSAELTEAFDGFDVDADSTAYGFTAGWRFNSNFALEAGYRNFGRFDQTFDVDGQLTEVSIKADGFVIGVLGTVPVGERFSLFGKLGSYFWDGDSRINDLTVATPGDTNLYLGAGVSFRLSERLLLTADASRYELDDTNSSVYSAGITIEL